MEQIESQRRVFFIAEPQDETKSRRIGIALGRKLLNLRQWCEVADGTELKKLKA